MNLVIRGKRIIISIIAILLLINVATIVSTTLLYSLNGDIGYATTKIIKGLIRLLLEIGISYNLYKGHNWSRWVFVVLLSLGGIVALISVIPLFNINPIFGIIYLVWGLLYIAICITLIVSKAVKAFMTYQRDGDIYNYESSSDNTKEPFIKPENEDIQ